MESQTVANLYNLQIVKRTNVSPYMLSLSIHPPEPSFLSATSDISASVTSGKTFHTLSTIGQPTIVAAKLRIDR